MKKILCLSAALFGTLAATAQTVPVKHWEFEPRLGVTTPLGGFHGGEPFVGSALGLELRYNLDRLPLDVGFALDVSTAVYDFPGFNETYGYDYEYEQSNRSFTLALLADYNFRRGRGVSPFVGAGLGLNVKDELNDVLYEADHRLSPFFMMRGGVEFFRHLRLTVSANLSAHGYHNMSFTLGYAFGGGRKKGK